MTSQLLVLSEKPTANILLAGWRRQWSDGGDISSGLPQYLMDKLGARKIGEMGPDISLMCYPFQVSGTHDSFRPRSAFKDGLPVSRLEWENEFYDAGNGLIIFLGDEPWFRMDLYGEAFFQAVQELGVKHTVAVEGYNGPAPPELERRVGCVYSKADMKQKLERYGIQFSNYGSTGRQGPTVGMALVNLAHFRYPEIEMCRLGAMAPMFPFTGANGRQIGLATDHRAFFDIMRRINAIYGLAIDLSELRTLGERESAQMQEALDQIGNNNASAKRIIEQARADYSFAPFDDPVNLSPELDRTLEDILRNMPDNP
jgi:predicted ATP-grasp superfamily ATP-dependent carboligase